MYVIPSPRGNPHTACFRKMGAKYGWICTDLNQEQLEESLRRNERYRIIDLDY